MFSELNCVSPSYKNKNDKIWVFNKDVTRCRSYKYFHRESLRKLFLSSFFQTYIKFFNKIFSQTLYRHGSTMKRNWQIYVKVPLTLCNDTRERNRNLKLGNEVERCHTVLLNDTTF